MNHEEAKAYNRSLRRGFLIPVPPPKAAPRKQKNARQLARVALKREVVAGRIVRPEHCESCGEERDVFAHHADYEKPLEVEWLCACCHRARHPDLAERLFS